MTSGNHIWDKKEVLEYIPRQPRLLRPANFPAGVPGRGSWVGQTRTGEPIAVINIMGRVFMQPLDDPFAVVLREIEIGRASCRERGWRGGGGVDGWTRSGGGVGVGEEW